MKNVKLKIMKNIKQMNKLSKKLDNNLKIRSQMPELRMLNKITTK